MRRTLSFWVVAALVTGCSRQDEEQAGRVDDWTWDAPELKTCTSPDKQKRARADVKSGEIELLIGEAGPDHPVDIIVHHSEMIPEPQTGKWAMKWVSDDEFAFEHSELGMKTWTVEGGHQMNVVSEAGWMMRAEQK